MIGAMLAGAGILFVGVFLGAALTVGSQPSVKTYDEDIDIP